MTFASTDLTPSDIPCAVGPNRESTDQKHEHLITGINNFQAFYCCSTFIRKEERRVDVLLVADVCETCWSL
jgi:hypothetical protein